MGAAARAPQGLGTELRTRSSFRAALTSLGGGAWIRGPGPSAEPDIHSLKEIPESTQPTTEHHFWATISRVPQLVATREVGTRAGSSKPEGPV